MSDHLDLLLDMLAALPDPVFVLTESGRYAALIGGGDRQHYHNGEHLIDGSLFDVLPKAKADWFLQQIGLTLAQNKLRIVEYGLSGEDVSGLDVDAGPDGEIWFEGRIQPLPQLVKNERAVVWVACNITRRHQLEAKLQHLSETDELTGAFNRRKLLEGLSDALESMRLRQTPTIVMLMDIDNFKSINDQYGHMDGDRVLRGIAENAMAHLRDGDIFARFGGEEFALLLPRASDASAAVIAERLRASIEAGVFLADPNFTATVSIGVTQILPGDPNIETILHRADEALYQAKHGGRNCVVITP